jgi:hypothetical protein
MHKPLLSLISTGAGLLLSGCAVYMPIQCAAPQIKDKNEVELTGSTYLNGRYEAAATYSPVRHLLVRAAYSSLPRGSNDSTYYRGHQYEVAAGTYWPLGSQWLLGGLAGFGQAHSEARYLNDGGLLFFGQSTQHIFDANYNKLFGEVYGSLQASNTVSFGAAYRVTQVKFTSLTDVGVPLDLRSMTRSEPMFFFRVRPGSGETDTRPVQLQFTLGTSATFGYQNTAGSSSNNYQIQKPRGYITLGVSLFPHCLLRQYRENRTIE